MKMKMKVVTTITSYMDLDTMTSEHTADINDEDRLSEVSREVLGAVVMGGLRATEKALAEQFPRLGEARKRVDETDESTT